MYCIHTILLVTQWQTKNMSCLYLLPCALVYLYTCWTTGRQAISQNPWLKALNIQVTYYTLRYPLPLWPSVFWPQTQWDCIRCHLLWPIPPYAHGFPKFYSTMNVPTEDAIPCRRATPVFLLQLCLLLSCVTD